MRTPSKLAAVTLGAVLILTLLSGCATMAEMAVRSEMQQKNEEDLRLRRQPPSEYQQRAEEIDRAFR